MKILAIDTATEYCSAALAIDGAVTEAGQKMPRGHSDHILAMVDHVLKEADIALGDCDAIAFNKGPGSFTGIRIGVGVAQGIALGNELPVVPVSSLHALAMQSNRDYVATAIDARMEQIYWACFSRTKPNQLALLDSENLINPDEVRLDQRQCWTAIGSGWDRYCESMQEKLPGVELDVLFARYPRAKDVALIAEEIYKNGDAVAPELGIPEYIRHKVTN